MSKKKHTYERAKRKLRALRARKAESRQAQSEEAAAEPKPVTASKRASAASAAE